MTKFVNLRKKHTGGGGYVAKAVHFDGLASTSLTKTVSTSNISEITISFWAKVPDASQEPTFFLIEPSSLLGNDFNFAIGEQSGTDLGFQCSSSSNTNVFNRAADSPLIPNATWGHYFMSASCNFSIGGRLGNVFYNGVSVVDPANDFESGTAIQMEMSRLWFPYTGNVSSAEFTMDVADFQCWLGLYIDPTLTNISKFIAGGKPVDPAVAALSFGQQSILWDGDATEFIINQGTIGNFTVTGNITDASTSPSD